MPKIKIEKMERVTKTAERIRNIFLCSIINIIYLLKPLRNKNRAALPSPRKLIAERKIRVMVMAENIETSTPIPRVRAKPLIKDVPNQKRIIEAKMLEIFESRIASQARENPAGSASAMVLPERSSSFTRSKIS